MTETTIRQATESDAELVAAISRETFCDSFAENNTAENMQLFLDGPFSTPLLMAELSDPDCIFFLIYHKEEPAGYIKLKPGKHPELMVAGKAIEICRFYARKHMIGKGIGKAMMQHAIAYAKENNYTTIWLGVWEQNQRAINFYHSFDFKKFSEHDFVLGRDVQRDWLMMKEGVSSQWSNE